MPAGRRRAARGGANVAVWVLAVAFGVGALGVVPSAAPETFYAGQGPRFPAVPAVPAVRAVDAPPLPTPPVPGRLAAPTPVTTTAAPVAYREATFVSSAPDGRAFVAIRTAMAQLGLPYVWGGDGPSNGDDGFDCSGLTTFSYAAAGLRLPRTAHTQYYAGPHVPAGDAATAR